MKMRRKDREVTDVSEINAVIEKCYSIKVGFYDDGHIYVVPVNFGFEENAGKYTFYFHGALAGRKAGLAKKGGLVGFEMDCDGEIMEGKEACDYSSYYASVIGEGTVSAVEEPDEKRLGLALLMRKISGKGDWNFPAAMLSRVGVFKIEVTELSCKAHKKGGASV